LAFHLEAGTLFFASKHSTFPTNKTSNTHLLWRFRLAFVYGCELGGIMKMSVEKTKVVATRVTKKTAELIAEFCKRDTHVNPADFIRDAIRDKLQREAPELYRLFQEA
jgi:hypothetical protein